MIGRRGKTVKVEMFAERLGWFSNNCDRASAVIKSGRRIEVREEAVPAASN
jgi:hypothetical protein